MAKRATVYDVAERAGVSIATVSFAFTRPAKVKESTLQLVLAAAADLGYVPSASARGLARGRTGAIGLYSYDYFLDSAEQPADEAMPSAAEDRSWTFPLYVDEVQRGVELECRRQGYVLLLSGERTPRGRPALTDVVGRVDALISFADTVPSDDLRQLSERIPVLEFNEHVRLEQAHTLTVENEVGMRRLTTHLIEAHGHRRIAFVGTLGTGEFQARYAGYTAAMTEHGLAPTAPLPSRTGVASTTRAVVDDLLSAGRLPDALVCATDQEAVVAIDALQAAGHRVGTDVAVTGFDGILAARLSSPALTTVEQPMEELGRSAVRILLDAIAAGGAAEHRRVPVTLRIRDSCGGHATA